MDYSDKGFGDCLNFLTKRVEGRLTPFANHPVLQWENAGSNILRILPPKNENFQMKNSG